MHVKSKLFIILLLLSFVLVFTGVAAAGMEFSKMRTTLSLCAQAEQTSGETSYYEVCD